jgi:selenium metabolism protein YedF
MVDCCMAMATGGSFMFIDAKGKPCPQPVILAMRALGGLKDGDTLQVQVDNEAAVENLKRMAQKNGAAVQVKADGANWTVEIVPADSVSATDGGAGSADAVEGGAGSADAADGGAGSANAAQAGQSAGKQAGQAALAQAGQSAEEQARQICAMPARGPVVVAVGSAEMGNGDPRLGRILMKSFLYSLTQLEELPQTVLFFNGGVRMTTEGSESIEDLKALEAQGVEILSCGTCLDFYGLKDKLRVGGITNMYVIAQTMAEAGNVVKI